MTVLRGLWRGLRAVLLALAAVVLLIEEWGWDPLTRWAAGLTRWPPLHRLEARIRTLRPAWAVALFLAPAAALFPVKLLALWLIHLGHAVTGVAVIVAAKLLGTALVGRLFIVIEPQLMQLPWFARALTWWRALKWRVTEALARWPLRRALRIALRRWKARVRRWAA